MGNALTLTFKRWTAICKVIWRSTGQQSLGRDHRLLSTKIKWRTNLISKLRDLRRQRVKNCIGITQATTLVELWLRKMCWCNGQCFWTQGKLGRKKWCEIRSPNNDARRGKVTSVNFDARLQKIITIKPSTVLILTSISRHGRLGLFLFLFLCAPKIPHTISQVPQPQVFMRSW